MVGGTFWPNGSSTPSWRLSASPRSVGPIHLARACALAWCACGCAGAWNYLYVRASRRCERQTTIARACTLCMHAPACTLAVTGRPRIGRRLPLFSAPQGKPTRSPLCMIPKHRAHTAHLRMNSERRRASSSTDDAKVCCPTCLRTTEPADAPAVVADDRQREARRRRSPKGGRPPADQGVQWDDLDSHRDGHARVKLGGRPRSTCFGMLF